MDIKTRRDVSREENQRQGGGNQKRLNNIHPCIIKKGGDRLDGGVPLYLTGYFNLTFNRNIFWYVGNKPKERREENSLKNFFCSISLYKTPISIHSLLL